MKLPEEKYKSKLAELSLALPQDYTKIVCPNCAEEQPADNININDKIAKCSQCNIVFPFKEAIASFYEKPTIRQEVHRPEGIDLFRYKGDLELTVQQPTSGFDTTLLTLSPYPFLFGVAWLLSGNSFFIWPTIVFGAIAIYGLYNWFTRSKHNIFIAIDEHHIKLKWQPKKFNKEKVYAIQDIDQLYVKPIGTTHSALYMIVNNPNGQKHVLLINRIYGKSKAKYLEQEIEQHLGIVDRVVPEAS